MKIAEEHVDALIIVKGKKEELNYVENEVEQLKKL